MSLLLLMRSRRRNRALAAELPALTAATVRSVGHTEEAALAPLTATLPRRASPVMAAALAITAALPRAVTATVASTLTLTASVRRSAGLRLTAALAGLTAAFGGLWRTYGRPPAERTRVRRAGSRKVYPPWKSRSADFQREVRTAEVEACRRVLVIPPEPRGKK